MQKKSNTYKNQKNILSKLGIETLNPMQEEAQLAIHSCPNVVLLSPTGTGKTVAFTLPVISELDREAEGVQALILVPSRELAIQIEQVIREMGTGYKTNAFYGGRTFAKDRQELKAVPSILIGTPGRIADHLRRGTFKGETVKTLVLDEFDKSLEVGFEEQMKEIVQNLPKVNKRILTSATQGVQIPKFVGLTQITEVNYLDEKKQKLEIRAVLSPSKDKLNTLIDTLCHLGDQPGIIFCNFKDSIKRVSEELEDQGISHACFYGGMEQQDRERALIKFRNGTHQLLLATDLAARGIDVPEIKFIIHYHLPIKGEEFTHRNGRTARMHSEGTAYVLQWEDETLPDFIGELDVQHLDAAGNPPPSPWTTLFISGGRKDKISKGDIAGLFFKQANCKKDELGIIELKSDCAFVAVKKQAVKSIIASTNNTRLKKKKVRVFEV